MQIVKKVSFILGFVFFLAVVAAAFFFVRAPNTGLSVKTPVDVFFFKTRNEANCTLLKQGDAVILIDTGESVDAPAIVAFLREQQVQTIDYLVLTHPDRDHIGGAASLLEQFDVRFVIQPYYAKENAIADHLTTVLDERSIPQIHPVRPRKFTCGEMRMTVYPPLEKHYRKDNNYSLAVCVAYEDINLAFAGDAEEKRLSEIAQIQWPSVQLYLVAHHGRASRSSAAFIEQLNPQYAIVTASGADESVQDALKKIGAQVFFTGNGTHHFVCNGETLKYVDEENLQ